MSDKTVKLPDIGFNEALKRIAKFHKDDLPVEIKPKKDNTATKSQNGVKMPNKRHK